MDPVEQGLLEPARWERLEGLFHRAGDLSPSERAACAVAWCHDDPALLADLLELLASDSSVEGLIAAGPQPAPTVAQDPLPGREIGPFLIECLLGRGGMGVVYRAHRVRAGFTQSVAVKLIARHLGSGPALTQFNLERDVLARLDHRNIARLVDAGTTPEGTPYVVMEYIEGSRLDEYADSLSGAPAALIKARLQLFLQLCDAVGYVHHNLILHRDLKPSNIMVTEDGTVKLLDFGTVKLLGDLATLGSELTQAGMRPMTLRYASPEHIRGEPLSTATDIYSAGVVLARILNGRLPDAEADLPDGLLPPDLDAVLRMATHPEAGRRYPSIGALAADLTLFLNGGPVTARPDTWSYRTSRFCRRNRGVLLASAMVALVLALGVGRMRHEAAVAVRQHRRAEAGVQEERKLAHLLLFDYFQELSDIPGSTDAQRKAATEATTYLDQLNRGTSTPELQLDIVQAYQKLGLLFGSPYVANLGDPATALATLGKAEALSRKLLALDLLNLDYRIASIEVAKAQAQVYFALKQPEKSVAVLLPAAALARGVTADPHATGKMLNQCGAAVKTLGDAYSQHANGATQNVDKAVEAYQESGRMYQASVDRGSKLYTGPIIANIWIGLVERSEDVDVASGYFRKALALIADLPSNERSKVAIVRLDQTCRSKLGSIYLSLGRQAEAEAILGPVHAATLRAITADPIDTRARDDLIVVDTTLLNNSPYKNASATFALMREYLDTTEYLIRTHPASHEWQFVHAEALLNFAQAYTAIGDRQSAAPYLARGLPEILAIARQPDADNETLSLAARALVYGRGDPALAIHFARQAIDGSYPATADQFLTLADAQRAAGLSDAARTSVQQALGLLAAHPRSLGSGANLAQAHALSRSLARSTP